MQERDYRLPSCYVIVSFLLLDIIASCQSMSMSEAIRQLSCHLAFNLCDLELSGIEQKPEVGLKFTLEQG